MNILYSLLFLRSPESVEMDEIMAAMVLTSLSCSPVVQSPPQRDLLPGGLLSFKARPCQSKRKLRSVCLKIS